MNRCGNMTTALESTDTARPPIRPLPLRARALLGTIRSPASSFQGLFQNLGGQGKRVHAGAAGAGVARILQPFHHHSGQQIPRCRRPPLRGPCPNCGRRSAAPAGQLPQTAAAHGEPALAAHVHLHVIDGVGQDQVEIALLAGLVLAGWPAAQCLSLSAAGKRRDRRAERLFQPRDAVFGHVARQILDGFQA